MRDFQAKRKIKRVLYSWITVSTLVVLNVLLLKSNIELFGKERYTAKNSAEAKKVYIDTVVRKEALAADVARLGTHEGVDLELRRKFQVVKPGEETVIIVTNSTTSTSTPLEQKPSFWQTVVGFFGARD